MLQLPTNARSAKWAALGAPRVERCALDAAPGVFSGWTVSLSGTYLG